MTSARDVGHIIARLPRAAIIAIALVLPGLVVAAPNAARACGWWGDGETSREDSTKFPTHDGKPLPERVSLETSRLPNEMGFGIAVPEPGRAIPYLQATYGRQPTRIGEFKTYGFHAVIDLGTPSDTAALHRAETEAAGLSYFSIPVVGETPSDRQTQRFSRIVLESADKSLLVYSPSSPLLAMMWAAHRINSGSPVSFAIAEGRSLGLTEAQEEALRELARMQGN